MFNFNDERTGLIAEALGNKTCKKILEMLSEKEATETDIARELKIPLNTVDYNVKKLAKAGLIQQTSHWWSSRGKKMPSYTVSNKKIIISPKKLTNIGTFLISVVGTGLLALGIKAYSSGIFTNQVRRVAEDTFLQTPMLAEKSATVAQVATETAPVAGIVGLAGWQWFLVGAWAGLVLFFVLTTINERRAQKK